jgi:hypothetical protein
MFEGCAGLSAENDFGAGLVGQLSMTANKISVEVRFNDVLDLELLRVCFFDVLVYIALRIDYCGFAV